MRSTSADGRSAKDVMDYSWDEVEKPVRFAFEAAKLVGEGLDSVCIRSPNSVRKYCQ